MPVAGTNLLSVSFRKRTCAAPGKDILTASANNLYVGLTMEDLEDFREEHPTNSRLVKQGGVSVDGSKASLETMVPTTSEPVIKVGKRSYHRIRWR